MTDRIDPGGGGMTGATGDLTPAESDRAHETGERREISDPDHHADLTTSQGRGAPAQAGETGMPGGSDPDEGPTNLGSRDDGYGSEHGLSPDDPAYRMERRSTGGSSREPSPADDAAIGGDEVSEGEERF